jgi:SAM-dependent methyltransferase
VSGNADLDVEAFFSIGRSCFEGMKRVLAKQGMALENFDGILDFGCGCGRVIRHLRYLGGSKVHGTDYNPVLIRWCRANLPFAEFQVNELEPPLGYPPATFDFIYAFSVFTHLPEPLQKAWMAELSRVLKPRGCLLITTQGAAYAEVYLDTAEERRFAANQLVVTGERRAGENICSAYHPFRQVQDVLAKDFDILEYVPGTVVDAGRRIIAQDTYLLRLR